MFTREWMYWLGWSGAVVVLLSMIIMAWWALFADRSRGRRRCPRCWYDMRYSPGMSCSECGFTATDERQLHRTRRRYGYALLAGLTCFVVIFNIRHMAVEDGTVSLLPTRVLTAAMALTDDPRSVVFNEVRRRFNNGLLSDSELRAVVDRCVKGDWQAAPPDDDWRATYGALLASWRFELSMMADREEDKDRARVLRAIEDRLLDVPVHAKLTTRRAWPREMPAVALLYVQEWWPLGAMMRVEAKPAHSDAPARVFYQSNLTRNRGGFTVPVGPIDEETSRIELDVSIDWRREEDAQWSHAWTGRLSVPVTVKGEVTDLIEPVNTEEQLAIMRETFNGDVRQWGHGRSPLRFLYRPAYTHAPEFDDVAIGVSLMLKHQGRLVRELHIWWRGGLLNGGVSRHLGWEIVYEDLDAIASISPQETGWVFTIEGRPDIALRAGDASAYWSGSYTIPAEFRTSPGEAPPPDWWTEEQEVLPSP